MLHYYFKDIKTPDAIILGCTHFPLIAKAISQYFNNHPILIHSGDAIVEYLNTKGYKNSQNSPEITIYASDNVAGLRSIASKWL